MTTDSQTEVLALKMLDMSIAVFPKREVSSIEKGGSERRRISVEILCKFFRLINRKI